jgi:Flp pilus assembly protein CpaB
MAESGNGGSSVNVVAIIAILVLVGVAGWFILGRRTSPAAPGAAATTAPATEKKSSVEVKVNLPDSVVIK